MKNIIDPHTHTVASGHAYNTIKELAISASEKGIKILGITDHGPALCGACSEYYFKNFLAVNRTAYGIRLLMGVEANIIDQQGSLDLPEDSLNEMDIIIASFHMQTYQSDSLIKNTEALIRAMERHSVTILGHPDDGKFPVDYETIVLEAKKRHVLVELNNASLTPRSYRSNGRENSLKILQYCKKHGTEIIMSSDAHFETDIGNFSYAEQLLSELDFPSDLVVNHSEERFLTYLRHA